MAAVEKTEQAYQTLQTEIGNAQQDGLINPVEHQAMLNALAQAQADKVAAQAEVDKLANSSVKDSLQGRLNNW